MKKTGVNIFTIAALLLSLSLHAAVIGGIAYAAGLIPLNHEKRADNNTKVKSSADQYAMLPDVEIISDRSLLKKDDKKDGSAQKKDGPGLKQASPEVKSGEDGRSVFSFRDAVKKKIQEARSYPDSAKRSGLEGTANVMFTIMPDGNVSSVGITGSSGEKVLDDEAVSTVKRASPFPPLPDKMITGSLNMQVAIVFKLN
jgi:TonB family protein